MSREHPPTAHQRFGFGSLTRRQLRRCTAPHSHHQYGGEQVQDGEHREHGVQRQYGSDALGQQPAQQSSDGTAGSDPPNGAARGSGVEPFIDDGPESGDQDRTDRGEVEIDQNGSSPSGRADQGPFRQQQGCAQSIQSGDQTNRLGPRHDAGNQDRKNSGKGGGGDDDRRQCCYAEAREEEGVASSLPGELEGNDEGCRQRGSRRGLRVRIRSRPGHRRRFVRPPPPARPRRCRPAAGMKVRARRQTRNARCRSSRPRGRPGPRRPVQRRRAG